MSEPFYKYKRIDLATDAIRLVRLLKGYYTDPIQCELAETYLHRVQGVPYEALSYTWGRKRQTAKISLNGHTALVTDNLYTALHCLRRCDEDRVLWVDAICIDQKHAAEKSHQVAQMRDVYRNAEDTLVWLGPSNDDIDELMFLMRKLDERAIKRTEYRRNSPVAWQLEWPTLLKELGGSQTGLYKQRYNGLGNIMERPWFRRVWILQEAANATKATIVCGWNSVPARTFVMMPSLMNMEPSPHVQSVLDIMPGHRRMESWWNETRYLRTLLKKFGTSNASDERDRIYALFGLSSDVRNSRAIQPNYSLKLQQVLRETISYLLFEEVVDPSLYTLPEWDFDTFLVLLDQLPQEVFTWALVNDHETTWTKLLEDHAIEVNESIPTKVLARHAENVNEYRFYPGGPPLCFLAAMGGPETAIRTLLDREDVNVNITAFNDRTPLSLAVEGTHKAVVDLLLAHKDIDVNYKNREGQTLLGSAILNKQSWVIDRILAQDDANVDVSIRYNYDLYTPLRLAAGRGDRALLELLLQKGANTEVKDILYGETPLHASTNKSETAMVKILLEKGADVNAERSIDRKTPLWISASYGYVDIVECLLEKGAEIETKDVSDHVTPIWIASRRGCADIVKLLLDHGADVESKSHRSETSLWIAASRGHTNVAKLLISRGANLEAADERYKATPVSIASRNNHAHTVRLLIEHGADAPKPLQEDGKLFASSKDLGEIAITG